MSYILDALNKSEKEKRRHQAPDLGVVHRDTPPPRKPGSIWLATIALPILLAVGAGAYWLGTSKFGISTPASDMPSASMPSASMPSASMPSASMPSASTPSATRSAVSNADKARVDNVIQGGAVAQASFARKPEISAATNGPSAASVTTAAPVVAKSGNSSPSPESLTADIGPGELITPQDFAARQNQGVQTSQQKKVVRIAELPPNIQRQIPDLTFSSHIFSDEPGFRMVNINGRSLREGDMIVDGIKLVEVSEEGVVISYLHYTFEVSVLRDWSFN